MKTGNTPAASRRRPMTNRASMEPGHEDREYHGPTSAPKPVPRASMEPGHEDREYMRMNGLMDITALPQWSPVMKTGNTTPSPARASLSILPQWSPVMKTGNTRGGCYMLSYTHRASMEPGHEDREYTSPRSISDLSSAPQWSPVMKTGNTPSRRVRGVEATEPQWSPVMKTGNT